VRLSLTPKTSEFYVLFARAAENALGVARLVDRRFREHPNSGITQEQVKAAETVNDGVTHDLIQLLNTQYITPFDREDIYGLAKRIDDVVDYIENASDLLGLYKVERTMPQALEQCRVLVDAVEILAFALAELRSVRQAERHLVEVKRLEDEGDRIVRDAIASLFQDDVDPLTVIRWKDIFDALEDAIDSCESAADVIGNIVVKNL
jgi:uncharacterized protein